MVAAVTERSANMDRFSGFADLYDANRPSAPDELGPLLVAYSGAGEPRVVDLGSGTGLSSRWAAGWAASVVGIEPNHDMRAQAESRPVAGVSYRDGTSSDTGLDSGSADIVLAVQAMHWMEPVSTLAEVARIVRPGGVFAAVDADWPPVSGVTGAEQTWRHVHRRVRVFEARAAGGETGDQLRRPIDDDDPALADDDLADPHRNRAMPGGISSWSKSQHLERIERSGHFAFAREVMLYQTVSGGADRFVALMRSQGSYQGLRRLGLDDDEIGVAAFEMAVHDAYAQIPPDLVPQLAFSWRVRLGVVGGTPT
jgi:SAM-dependent methyltransferase